MCAALASIAMSQGQISVPVYAYTAQATLAFVLQAGGKSGAIELLTAKAAQRHYALQDITTSAIAMQAARLRAKRDAVYGAPRDLWYKEACHMAAYRFAASSNVKRASLVPRAKALASLLEASNSVLFGAQCINMLTLMCYTGDVDMGLRDTGAHASALSALKMLTHANAKRLGMNPDKLLERQNCWKFAQPPCGASPEDRARRLALAFRTVSEKATLAISASGATYLPKRTHEFQEAVAAKRGLHLLPAARVVQIPQLRALGLQWNLPGLSIRPVLPTCARSEEVLSLVCEHGNIQALVSALA